MRWSLAIFICLTFMQSAAAEPIRVQSSDSSPKPARPGLEAFEHDRVPKAPHSTKAGVRVTRVSPPLAAPPPKDDPPRTGAPALHGLDLSGYVPETVLPFPVEPGGGFAVGILSQELSRAVAQGLVDAPEPANPVPPRPAAPTAATPTSVSRNNIVITTAIDREFGGRSDLRQPTHQGTLCLPDSFFDISSWGAASEPSSLGQLRGRLLMEDGRPSEPGMRALVRYYIAMGFGAEATALAGFISDPSERAVLQILAEIVDHGESESVGLNAQIVCQGKVALWSMLAQPVDRGDRPVDVGHILSTFSELPVHLRIHLGPALSERLREIGFPDEAQIALNATTRGGTGTPAQDLTAARLGLSGTTADVAREELEALSKGTDLIAAEALLELLLDAERRSVPPETDWVADAPSLVRATQGTETAAALNLAALRGRIALGQFDALRAALNEWSPGLNDARRRALASMAISAAGEVADAPTFLRTELALSKIAAPDLIAPPARANVAERLIGLGLPTRALTYLDQDAPRRLRAAALTDLARFDEAISLLSEDETPEALADLGRVFLRDGQTSAAVDAFARASEIARASRAAMRDADWVWLSTYGEAGLADAARSLLGAGTPDDAGEKLGNARLLERAQNSRAQAEALLATTRIDRNGPEFTN